MKDNHDELLSLVLEKGLEECLNYLLESEEDDYLLQCEIQGVSIFQYASSTHIYARAYVMKSLLFNN